MAVPFSKSPTFPPGLRYVTIIVNKLIVLKAMGVYYIFTVQICGYAGCEASRRSNGERTAEVDEAGYCAAMDRLKSVLGEMSNHIIL